MGKKKKECISGRREAIAHLKSQSSGLQEGLMEGPKQDSRPQVTQLLFTHKAELSASPAHSCLRASGNLASDLNSQSAFPHLRKGNVYLFPIAALTNYHKLHGLN